MDKTQIKALVYTATTVVGCIAALTILFWKPEVFCGLLMLGCILALLTLFICEIYKGYLKSIRSKE